MPRCRRQHLHSTPPSWWPSPMPCPRAASSRPLAREPSRRPSCSRSSQASRPSPAPPSGSPSLPALASSPLPSPWLPSLAEPLRPCLPCRLSSYRRSAACASWSSPRLPPRLASHDGRRIDCLFELLPFEMQHLELSLQVVDIGLFRVTRPDTDESLKIDEALLHLLLAQSQQAYAQRLPVRLCVGPHAACPGGGQQTPGQVGAGGVQSRDKALEIRLRVGGCNRLGPCRCQRMRRFVPEGESLSRRLLGCQAGVQKEQRERLALQRSEGRLCRS